VKLRVASWVLVVAIGAPLLLSGCPEGGAPAPRAPSYHVHLQEVGPNHDQVVAAIASLRGGTRVVAEGLVKRKRPGLSLPVATGFADRAAADAAVADLEAAGASAAVVEAP
jgi:hypothetical protein